MRHIFSGTGSSRQSQRNEYITDTRHHGPCSTLACSVCCSVTVPRLVEGGGDPSGVGVDGDIVINAADYGLM